MKQSFLIKGSENVNSVYPQKVIEFCTEKMNSPKNDDKSPFLVSFLVEHNFMKAKQMKSELQEKSQDDIKASLVIIVNSSIEMLRTLADKYDVIRQNYWNYMISRWQREFTEYI